MYILRDHDCRLVKIAYIVKRIAARVSKLSLEGDTPREMWLVNDCSPFVRQYRLLEELVHLDLAPHRVTQECGCGARRGRGNGNNVTRYREWHKVATEVANATIRLRLRFLNGLHAI